MHLAKKSQPKDENVQSSPANHAERTILGLSSGGREGGQGLHELEPRLKLARNPGAAPLDDPVLARGKMTRIENLSACKAADARRGRKRRRPGGSPDAKSKDTKGPSDDSEADADAGPESDAGNQGPGTQRGRKLCRCRILVAVLASSGQVGPSSQRWHAGPRNPGAEEGHRWCVEDRDHFPFCCQSVRAGIYTLFTSKAFSLTRTNLKDQGRTGPLDLLVPMVPLV